MSSDGVCKSSTGLGFQKYDLCETELRMPVVELREHGR